MIVTEILLYKEFNEILQTTDLITIFSDQLTFIILNIMSYLLLSIVINLNSPETRPDLKQIVIYSVITNT